MVTSGRRVPTFCARLFCLSLGGLALALGLAAASSMGAGPARADDFYAGKQLRILIGYGPGTGYDVFGRVMGRHIANHIPGAPTVLPINMPGASSLTMVNHLYNVAPRDGTNIAVPARNLFVQPLFGNDQARYDSRKFSWIGSITREVATCFTWHTSGIKTIADATKREVLVGATSTLSGSYQFPRVINEVVGTRFKTITGYADSGEVGLAMERGEVQGYCSFTWGSLKSARPQWLEQKQITLLLQMTLRRHPELPDVPMITDFAKDEAARQLLDLVFADQEMGRPVNGPPEIPPERLTLLRRAFDATMADKAFLEDAERTGIDVDPITGEQVEQILARLYATPKPVIDKLVAIRK